MIQPILAPSQVIDRLDSSASYRTFITAGSANVKGSYTEITASAPRAYSGFYILGVNSASVGDYLLDIAVGGAGSEVIIAENVPWSFANLNENLGRYVPIHIPAGIRLAMRVQSNVGAATLQVAVYGVASAGQPFGYQRAISYGVNLGDSGGTEVDPGATPDTKGSYVEVTASLTAKVNYLEIIIGNRGNGLKTEGSTLVDISIGGAGSEIVKIADISLYCDANSDGYTPSILVFPLELPAGTRISARAQSTITDAADRLIDISIVGYS